MKKEWFFITLLILGCYWIVNGATVRAQIPPKTLTLLYSNNLNGEIEPCPTWDQKSRLGGLAKRAEWVKEVRENGKEILVLDAGDLLFKKYTQHIPENELEGVTQKAQLITESFNLMRYDAVGIGDDDLSLGKEFLREISKKARFPFLSSNLLDEGSVKPMFQPYLIKEIHGLRIGIFSLLAPEAFFGPSDSRRKGLTILPPTEVAQSVVKELQPKTDLVILLSHLGYQKDVELAQAVQGIHLIIGSHTGINLVYPPFIKHTLILQVAPKGMYAARLDLILHNSDPMFYNSVTRRAMENNLNSLKSRLNSAEAPEAEKVQWRKAKEEAERNLKQFQGKNEFTNSISPLSEQMKDDPDVLKMIEAYRQKFPEPRKASTQK